MTRSPEEGSSNGDKITLVLVIAVVVLLSVRLVALYGQELHEDETGFYFEHRGYNVTTFEFLENGILRILAEPLQEETAAPIITRERGLLML